MRCISNYTPLKSLCKEKYIFIFYIKYTGWIYTIDCYGGGTVDYLSWIPRRIAELRVQKGVSARDMSLSLGQSESYINKIENGRTMPSMAGLLYICEYFGITPQDFFNLNAPAPQKLNEFVQEFERLSPTEADHILQIIKDITVQKGR